MPCKVIKMQPTIKRFKFHMDLREPLSAIGQISCSRCNCATDITSDRFPLFSVLRSCNDFRPGNEMERLHVRHNLVPLLFLWGIFRAVFLFWGLGSGACFAKVPKLFGRISWGIILFISSKRRRLEARNLLFLFPLQHVKRSALQNKRVRVLRMAFRTEKFPGLSRNRAPGSRKSREPFGLEKPGDKL